MKVRKARKLGSQEAGKLKAGRGKDNHEKTKRRYESSKNSYLTQTRAVQEEAPLSHPRSADPANGFMILNGQIFSDISVSLANKGSAR
jgi:hypothetical protein